MGGAYAPGTSAEANAIACQLRTQPARAKKGRATIKTGRAA